MTQRKVSLRGFTLIELSIVLVIIGLIIGGVLTGQQIILNARITNAINAIQSYQAQFQTYAQNYGALPGDDNSATKRFLGGTAYKDGLGLGTVGTDSSFNTTSVDGQAGESRLVWAHLRAAGLVKNQIGDTGNAVQPPNSFGGVYGFQNGAFGGVFVTTTLCLDKVPADAAQTIDTRLDDGQSGSGALQATAGAVNSSPAASSATSSGYKAGETYTLCLRM